jgi:hypothetical protein
MPRGKKWTDSELDYLYKFFAVKTDAEIAADLGRPVQGVTEKRRLLDMKKNRKGVDPAQVDRLLSQHKELRESTNVADLDEVQKTRHWLNELDKSPIWTECILMFADEELALYRKKYVDFMLTLDTINEVEKGTVHIMISCLIRINRYQKLEKEYRDMAKGNMDSELAAKSITLHKEMKDMAELYLKANQDLDTSRAQRIRKEGEQKMTVLELLRELEKREAREKMGREADALSRIRQLETARLDGGYFVRGSKNE